MYDNYNYVLFTNRPAHVILTKLIINVGKQKHKQRRRVTINYKSCDSLVHQNIS